jgi:hypothetical protein
LYATDLLVDLRGELGDFSEKTLVSKTAEFWSGGEEYLMSFFRNAFLEKFSEIAHCPKISRVSQPKKM